MFLKPYHTDLLVYMQHWKNTGEKVSPGTFTLYLLLSLRLQEFV